MRLTAFGAKAIAFYGVVLTAYFASPYTNLFFLLVAFLTALFALNVVWTRSNLRGVRGSAAKFSAVPAHGVTECDVYIVPGRAPSLQVTIELQIGRQRHRIGESSMIAEPGVLRCRLPALPRGIHAVTGLRATSSYPLGLLRARRELDAPSTIVVYPEPLGENMSDAAAAVRRDDAGEDVAHMGAASAETSALREDRDGDTIRHVHWRASARNARTLVVREFEPLADRAIHVRLDARCDEDDFELSLRAIARLALVSQDLDQPIYLFSQGIEEAFGAGRTPLIELWKWLAIAARRRADEPAPPGAPQGSDAVELPAALHRLGKEPR